jgi:uncharacterized delta-60 repeat protein
LNPRNDFVNSVAVQKDGKIVAAGSAFARYNIDGSLDNTFLANGIQSNINNITSLAIQSDGKIVVAGASWPGNGSSFTLSRYNSNGSFDNSFGENGTTYAFSEDSYHYSQNAIANSVAIQGDGKIVAVGNGYGYYGDDFLMARFNADGSVDNTFGSRGTVTSRQEDVTANAVSIQSDGTIVVILNSPDSSFLVTYDTKGERIKYVETGLGNDYSNLATSVAIQHDDKIVVAGNSKGNFALVRFNKDASLDSSFSENGKKITDVSGGNDGINAISIDSNKIYAVGSSIYSGSKAVVARYLLAEDVKAPSVKLTVANNIVKYAAAARIKLNVTVANVIGTISKVQFYSGTTLLYTEHVSPYGFLWTDVPVGTYTLTAKAIDNKGNIVTSNAINVLVQDENVAPVVSIISPVDDTTYTGPATIHLIAKAKDANDRISKVEFYNGTALLRTEYIYPYICTRINVEPGIYTITAKAYDDKGLSTVSAPVTITVINPQIVSSRAIMASRKTGLNLILSPNPASNILQIAVPGSASNRISTASILSAAGVLLKTVQLIGSNTELDISSLASGVYNIKVVSGDKVISKRFVKL